MRAPAPARLPTPDPVHAAVRCAAVAVSTGFAAFTLLAGAARVAGWSFNVLFGGAIAIWSVVAPTAAWRLLAIGRRFSRRDAAIAALLVALALASGALALAINAPEEDDSLYVPQAVQALAHPARPLSTELTWIVPFANGARPRNSLAIAFNNVELLWACVSRVTGIDLLVLYQPVGALVFAAAFVVAVFLLVGEFPRSTTAALGGTFVAILLTFVVFRDGGTGFGASLNKFWIGKTVAAVTVVPVVAALAIEFMRQPTVRRWTWLTLSIVASTGVSSSSLFLMPCLMLALMPAAFVDAWQDGATAMRRWLRAAALPAAAIYPVALGLFYTVTYKGRLAEIQEDTPRTSRDFFRLAFTASFASWPSAATLAVLAAWRYLVIRRQPPP